MPMPSMMNEYDATERGSLTRRRILAASGAALATAVAGCSTVIDAIANQVLEDVNVLNQLGREVSGSVTVTGPAGATVLDETFEVPSTEADDDSNIVAYDDVWRATGEYEISAELSDIEIEGSSQARESARIENADEEMVAVSVRAGDTTEPIAIRVGESLSDFGRPTETL
jgi:hypothetical protein